MAREPLAVKLGAGFLYTAPLGTAFPLHPLEAPGVAWEDIGYSESGWVFKVDRTFEKVNVHEEVDMLDKVLTEREITLQGVALQVTLDNLRIAFNGGTITADAGSVGPPLVPPTKKYVLPGGNDDQLHFAFLLRVAAPGTNLKRDIKMASGLNVAAIETAYQRGGNDARRKLAFEVTIIKPAAGNIVEWVDQQAA